MIRRIASIALISSVIGFQAYANCTNFVGTWKGQCQSNSGQMRNKTVTIMQNACDTIVIENRIFPIGQVIETHIPAQPGETNVTYEVMNFTNNYSDLQYLYTAVATKPGQSPIQFNISTTYKRNGNFMVSESYQSENSYRETCQYFLQ
ncbi:MAG: hypothetical protein ACXVCY_16750 [Pseudobdellovibrionaceae bacterium]